MQITVPRLIAAVVLALLTAPGSLHRCFAQQVPSVVTRAAGGKQLDRFGDPLPTGAIARIGTQRFRPGPLTWALSYSPNGKMLASATGRGIQIWDAATGKELRAWEFPRTYFYGDSLAFSPDNQLLAVGTQAKVSVLDIATGRELRSWKAEGKVVAFSPDGSMVAAGGQAVRPIIHLWELVTGRELRKWSSQSSLNWIRFAADSKILVTRGWNQTVRTWDTATGNQLVEWKTDGASGTGTGFDMTADGKTIASPASDGSLCLYEAATGKKLRAWQTKSRGPVAFSPDGKMLAFVEESCIRLREVASGKEVCTCSRDRTYFPVIAFAPDGKAIAAAEAASTIRLWQVPGGKEIPMPGYDAPIVYSAALAEGSRTLATVGTDYTVRLWDTATGKETRRWAASTTEFSRIVISPDGRSLAARGDDQTVRIWDIASGKEIQTWKVRAGTHAFSPDGKALAVRISDPRTRTGEAKIILWDVTTGKELRSWQDQTGHYNTIAFSPDGRALASGGYEQKSIRLWDPTIGTLARDFKGPGAGTVFAMVFSPDGRTLATVGHDNSVRLWETLTGQEIRSWTFHGGCLAFSPDGRALAVGGRDGSIRLWDVGSGGGLWVGTGHRSSVQSVAFSSDGQVLASSSFDTTALLWDLSGRIKARPAAAPLSAEQLQSLWSDLAGADPRKGFAAIHSLAARPQQIVPLVKERVQPVSAVDARKLQQRIADLSSNEFKVRQRATEELEQLGELAELALRKTLADRPPLEMTQRLERLLAMAPNLRVPPAEQLRALRSVQVLEHAGTPEALEVLNMLGARCKRGSIDP